MRAFLKGFVYAANGIIQAIASERNLRFHLCVAVYVIVFSRFYSLTKAENALLAILLCLIPALELLNSALECVVDIASPKKNKLAGMAKDMAAGAVLFAAIGAIVCGVILFWDLVVFRQIMAWFSARPLMIGLLVVSLLFAIWFVFLFGKKKEHGSEQSK